MAVIEAVGVSRRFGKLLALDDVSLSVDKGEIFGLLGPNGAGKTTLISLLTTLRIPSKGSIRILGFDVLKQGADVRKNIAVVFQELLLDDGLKVYDVLDIHGMIYKIPKIERKKRIIDVLRIVDLEKKTKSKVETLSGGMKRRLEIARGLLSQPNVLFLDEPTLGLDPISRRDVWDYIKKANKENHTTIVLATNNLEEAERLCSRVAIMNEGKIVELDKIKKIKAMHGKNKSLEDAFIKIVRRQK